MFKRGDSSIYDIILMFKFLDIIIKALKIHERFSKVEKKEVQRIPWYVCQSYPF